MQAMLAAVQEAMRGSGRDPDQVLSIGVSGQQHGMVVLDEDGQVTDKGAQIVTQHERGTKAFLSAWGLSTGLLLLSSLHP